METVKEHNYELLTARVLLALCAVLFFFQCLSIESVPVADGLRWFGDETWLMAEARTHIAEGIVRLPEAMGSTLQHGKGFVLGMPWLSSLLYGVPILIAGKTANIVLVGRIVSTILAGMTLLALYYFLKRFGVSILITATLLMALLSSNAFLFGSHSARPDILAGLILLLVIYYKPYLLRESANSGRQYFIYGAILSFLAWTSSPHLLTLLFPIGIFALFYYAKRDFAKKWLPAILGAVASLVLLVIIYFISTGDFSLFRISRSSDPFSSVAGELPILRPFSRSVQVANILIRVNNMWEEAPQILIVLLTFIVLVALPRIRREIKKEPTQYFIVMSGVISILSWLFLEAAGRLYMMHLFPILVLCSGIVLQRVLTSAFCKWAVSIAAIAIISLGFWNAARAKANGEEITQGNHAAMKVLRDSIYTISKRDHINSPVVLAEVPALEEMMRDTFARAMTNHFIAYYDSVRPLSTVLEHADVRFAVLFNSPHWGVNRYTNDPIFKTIDSTSVLVTQVTGKLFDFGRHYFRADDKSIDTLKLYYIKKEHP